jgi:hypothetical protein
MFDEKRQVAVPTLFQSFFAHGTGQTLFSPNALDVDIDIKRYAGEKRAALVRRGKQIRSIEGFKNDTQVERFTTIQRAFPLIEEEANIGADQLYFRDAGEMPHQNKTTMMRLRNRLSQLHAEQIARTLRTCEYLASQSILEGEMPAILGTTDTDSIYDFKRKSTHIYNVATPWTGAADIMGDFNDAWDLIRVDAHRNARVALLSGSTMAALIANDTIAGLADNRRFQMVSIGDLANVPSDLRWMIEAGAVLQGRMFTDKGHEFWLFTYETGRYDLSGTSTKYLPDGQVLIFDPDARCDRYFGPDDKLPMTPSKARVYTEYMGLPPGLAPAPANVKNMGAVLNPAMFYFDIREGHEGKTLTLRSQAAPIFAPTETDAFVTLKQVTV